MGRGSFRPRLLSYSRGQGFIVEYFLSFALFLFVFVSVLVLLVQTLLPRVDDSRFYTNTMMARRAALQLLTEEAGYVQWWNKDLNTRVLLNITDHGGERSSHRWVNISGQRLNNSGIDISVIDFSTLHVYERSYMSNELIKFNPGNDDALNRADEIHFKVFLGDLRSVVVHLYFDRLKNVVPVEKYIVNTEKDTAKRGLADDLDITARAPTGSKTGKGRTFDYALSTIDVQIGQMSQIISVTWTAENATDYLTVGRTDMDLMLNTHPYLDLYYKVTGTDNPFNMAYIFRYDSNLYQDTVELYPLDANATGVWRHVHMNLEDAAHELIGISSGHPSIHLTALFINLTDAERDRWEGSTFLYFDDITLKPPDDTKALTGGEGTEDRIHAVVMETLEQAHWLARNEIPESFGFTTDEGRTLNHTSIVRFRELQSIESYEELKHVLGIDDKYHTRIKIVRPVSRNIINVTTDETIYDYGTNRTVHINIIMPPYVTDKWPEECTFPSYTSEDPCILLVLLRPDGTSTTLVVPHLETITERVETRFFTDKDTVKTGEVVFSRLAYATDYNLTITDPAGTYGIQVYALAAEPRGLLHGYGTFSLSR
ncbi:MAG: hypothetical protein QF415_10550 [Candidatus Undinarchaeales archaeon]|nr:hypothetical protein [Candidatus Undinarchaeales archaeon]